MFCIYCGTANPDNAKYCHKCGRNIGGFQNASRVWPPGEVMQPVGLAPSPDENVQTPQADMQDRRVEAKRQPAPPPIESARKAAPPPAASAKPTRPVEPLFAEPAEPAPRQPERPVYPVRENPEPPAPTREAPPAPAPSPPPPRSWPPSNNPESDEEGEYPGYPNEMGRDGDYPGNGDEWGEEEDFQIRKEGFFKRIMKKREFRIALIGIIVCILVILFALNNLLHFIRF